MTTISPLAASLTTDERALLDSAARFRRDHVAPRAAGWERARQMARESLREAARLGLTGIEVPRVQGGHGAGFVAKALIAEELARSCMAFAFSLINTQNVAVRIAGAGSAAQIARYLAPLLAGELIGGTSLTEPHAGSDFPAISTTARRAGSGWVLDGEKAWLSNAAVAEVIIVFAKTDAALDSDGIAAFLIDARGAAAKLRQAAFGSSGPALVARRRRDRSRGGAAPDLARRRSHRARRRCHARRRACQEIRGARGAAAARRLHAGNGCRRLARGLPDRPPHRLSPHRRLCRWLDRDAERAHRRAAGEDVFVMEVRPNFALPMQNQIYLILSPSKDAQPAMQCSAIV